MNRNINIILWSGVFIVWLFQVVLVFLINSSSVVHSWSLSESEPEKKHCLWAVSACLIWNSLPEGVENAQTLDTFHSGLPIDWMHLRVFITILYKFIRSGFYHTDAVSLYTYCYKTSEWVSERTTSVVSDIHEYVFHEQEN